MRKATHQICVVASLQDQTLDMIANGELPSWARFVGLEYALQLLFDRAQRILRHGAHVDKWVSPSQASDLLFPLNERVVYECVKDVHETVFVLS